MSRRDLRLLMAVCALALVWLVAQGVVGASAGLLFLAPAMFMALPLLAGRYLGAERLSRVSRSRAPRGRRVRIAIPARRVFCSTPPRGGLLIASSLAVRPPPLAVFAY
jgi:hypothetical protein